MVFTHTNSKGIQYFLNTKEVTLRGGQLQTIYYFSKQARPEGIDDVPSGFVVGENPRNGFLTVRRPRKARDGGLGVSVTDDSVLAKGQSLSERGEDFPGGAENVTIVSLDLTGERAFYRLPDLVSDARGRQNAIEFQPALLGSSLSRAVELLRVLVQDPEVPEQALQELMEDCPDLFPGDYLEVRAHVRLESASETQIPDFVLRPVYGLWDISELKLPSVKLLARGPHGRPRLTAKVQDGLQQVRGYADVVEDPLARARLREKYDIEMFKPRLQLIIGTSRDLDRLALQEASRSQAPDVMLHTWDDVIAIGESRLRRTASNG